MVKHVYKVILAWDANTDGSTIVRGMLEAQLWYILLHIPQEDKCTWLVQELSVSRICASLVGIVYSAVCESC